MTWQLQLAAEKAHLFTPYSIPGSVIIVGDGWRDIVESLLDDVDLTGAAGIIDRIESKYGTLRVQLGGSAPADNEMRRRIDDAFDLAEARSTYVCETCGKDGCLTEAINGWLTTACRDHGRARGLPTDRDDLVITRAWIDGRLRITRCRRYARDRDRFVEIDPASIGLDE